MKFDESAIEQLDSEHKVECDYDIKSVAETVAVADVPYKKV